MVYYNFDAALQMAQQYDANLAAMNSKQRADVSESREEEEGKTGMIDHWHWHANYPGHYTWASFTLVKKIGRRK
jgi:hypothetical protein